MIVVPMGELLRRQPQPKESRTMERSLASAPVTMATKSVPSVEQLRTHLSDVTDKGDQQISEMADAISHLRSMIHGVPGDKNPSEAKARPIPNYALAESADRLAKQCAIRDSLLTDLRALLVKEG